MISFAVTAKLICVFVFAYAQCWFSHDTAQIYFFRLNCFKPQLRRKRLQRNYTCQLTLQRRFVKLNMSTHLCNLDPIEPYFYTVKLGFTGVPTIYVWSKNKQNIKDFQLKIVIIVFSTALKSCSILYIC